MSYIGSTPTTQSFIEGTDYFNGDGSTTAFTLSRSVVSVNDIQATINNVVQQPNTAYTVSGTTITFTSAPSAGTANIYVRYLSTTTQSITPSQNTVSYSTLNSDNQSKLGISFKNRIINGAMVIDQRNAGASVTITNTSALTYTLDRWAGYCSVASKFSMQQTTGLDGFPNALVATSLSAYTVGSGELFKITQPIEGYNIADLNWGGANAQTVTLSFWVKSSLTGTFGGAVLNSAFNRNYPFTYTINAANTYEKKSITIPGDTTGTWLTTNGIGMQIIWSLGTSSTLSGPAGAWASGNIQSATGTTSVVGTNGATLYLAGVQLEVGTQATTFDYRSYGTELALCQRYYWASTRSTYNAFGSGIWSTTTQAVIYVKHPVSMRASPTFGYSGTLYIHVNSGSSAVSSIAAQYSGLDSSRLDINSSSSTTAGFGAVLFSDNGASTYIYAGAEL